MTKTLFFLSLFLLNLHAKDIKPAFVMQTSGLVNDFVVDRDKVYVATNEGTVDIFDLRERKLVNQIFIKPTLSVQGELITSNVLSVDRHNNKTLIVSTSTSAFRNVWLHDGEKLSHVINTDKKQVIRKARFIDDAHFMFGSAGYEMTKYTLNDDYSIYKTHVEPSAFSDMELSEDKSIMITASESGAVSVSDVKTGKVIKKHDSLNVDNIYKVAYKNGNIITAGQDRRVGVYPKEGKPYYIRSDFLVYAVGLSPSGKMGVYSSGEKSNLQLFDVSSGRKLDRLIGHVAVPSTIRFFSEEGFFSAGYENKLFYWHLK